MATIDHHDSRYHTADAPDKAAGFRGLIIGVVLLLVVMYGIVQWTNGLFEGHAPGAAAAPGATAPAAGH